MQDMSSRREGVLDGIRVHTALPGPNAARYLQTSVEYEPHSMSEQLPVVWKRAYRVYVQDVDDNVFMDFTSGVLVANIGHSHPEVVKAMQDQADQVVNCYDFANEYRPFLAKRLVEITPPNLEKAFILTTGSEATEAAIKVARRYTGKYEIIAFQGAFHGRTMGAMSIGGKRSGAGSRGFGPFVPGVVHAPFPYCYRCSFGKEYPGCDLACLEYLDDVYDYQTEKNVAAVITEAYQGGAGSIIPPPEWYPRLAEWCKRRDILLIFDEVQASFGRTGKLFCFEHYGITPNLLCLGKGISGGVPVSALVGEKAIMDVLSPGTMSSTHGGNAFCSRAALVNIDVLMRERLWENAAAVGDYFMSRFKEMQEKVEFLGDVRGLGLVLGLEIVTDRQSKRPDPKMTQAIINECYRRGLMMIAPIGNAGNVIRIAPPLVITMEEAKVGLDIVEAAMLSLSAARQGSVA